MVEKEITLIAQSPVGTTLYLCDINSNYVPPFIWLRGSVLQLISVPG